MWDIFNLVSHESKIYVIILHICEILSNSLNNILICWCISTKPGNWLEASVTIKFLQVL